MYGRRNALISDLMGSISIATVEPEPTPPTGKHISTVAIRIDRIQNSKTAEHWSGSDIFSPIQQLQG
jgi:hypothetical protein